nr:MAG: hypothetical protein KatS3mg041_1218 [Bacteroidota bacterium]
MFVRLTEAARARLQALRAAHPERLPALRLSMACSACGGLAFGLAWETEPDPQAHRIELEDGWYIVLDPSLIPYAQELLIDHTETPYGEAFVLLSPYGASSCFWEE